MDKRYAKYLLEKTYQDYNSISGQFSSTRQSIWPELDVFANYVKEADRVLDLGCGNGRLLQLFEGKDIDYVGTDNSEKLIEIAKKKYPNRDFQVVDALDLPFCDNSFDIIYSIAVLHHIPSEELRLQFLKEAKRVLRPGGHLILTVWKFHKKRELFLIFKFNILKLIGLSKMDFYDFLEPWGKKLKRYYHRFSEKELIELAKRTGIQVIETNVIKNDKGNRQNIYLILKKRKSSGQTG